MKFNHLFECPKGSLFAQLVGISYKNHMTCFPLGAVVGMSKWGIVIFGMGKFYLRMETKDGSYYDPKIAKQVKKADEIMEDLKRRLDKYHGKI